MVVLAIEGAQRVELRTLAAFVAHIVRMVEDELAHLIAVCRPARRIAHRVDEQAQLGKVEAQALVELHEHDDALGIRRRIGRAEPFDTYLVELAQAPLLRALAAKHRLGIVELDGRGALRHEVVLYHGAHHAGRALGTKREALLGLELGVRALRERALQVGAREYAEHLLAYHVGRLPDAVHEHVDLLDGRRLHGLEAVRPEHLGSHALHALPCAHLAPDQVLGALCFLCLHREFLPEPSGRPSYAAALHVFAPLYARERGRRRAESTGPQEVRPLQHKTHLHRCHICPCKLT